VKRIAVVVTIFIAALISTNSIDGGRSVLDKQDADELLRQVVAAYHSFSAYSDKGNAIVHLRDSDYKIEFETLFKRPDKLRFAWTLEYSHTPGYHQNNVIWSDGTTAWASYSFHGSKPEQKGSLELAVASATGASWATAHTISRLLSDEVTGLRLDELRGLKVIGKDTVDGVDSVVVAGYLGSGEEYKVWIGSEDHLVRRIEKRSKDSTYQEVRKHILVNREIADSRFSESGR
jgi:outer membrane lipoprotein-sorting protein